MGCPDWRALAVRRERQGAAAEAAWRSAVAHLGGCRSCRAEALAADPLLVFRRLPAADPSDRDEREIAAGVAALRRARQEDRSARRRRRWMRAAGLLLPALALLSAGEIERSVPGAGPPPRAAHLRAPASTGVATSAPAVAPLGTSQTPLLERVEIPGARIYELRQDDLAVVMIVDEALDV